MEASLALTPEDDFVAETGPTSSSASKVGKNTLSLIKSNQVKKVPRIPTPLVLEKPAPGVKPFRYSEALWSEVVPKRTKLV